MRRLIGRFLVFHTSALPKRMGIHVRRAGRKLLFSKKQRVEATRRVLREELLKVRAELIERNLTKTYALNEISQTLRSNHYFVKGQ